MGLAQPQQRVDHGLVLRRGHVEQQPVDGGAVLAGGGQHLPAAADRLLQGRSRQGRARLVDRVQRLVDPQGGGEEPGLDLVRAAAGLQPCPDGGELLGAVLVDAAKLEPDVGDGRLLIAVALVQEVVVHPP